MRLDLFVEGPLLRSVFVVFFMGIAVRIAFFLKAIATSAKDKDGGLKYLLLTLSRSLLPFHSGIKKKPLYTSLRYVFHICLFVVPIFLFAHIILWEESRFEWSWSALPDIWADRMTLLVLAGCLTFLLRRMILPNVRRSSSLSDYLFLFLVSLPFLTGYLLSHGMPASLPFLQNNMWTFHVLSGELLLVSAVFLFLTTRLVEDKCTGCAAFVLNCPTVTLEAADRRAVILRGIADAGAPGLDRSLLGEGSGHVAGDLLDILWSHACLPLQVYDAHPKQISSLCQAKKFRRIHIGIPNQ